MIPFSVDPFNKLIWFESNSTVLTAHFVGPKFTGMLELPMCLGLKSLINCKALKMNSISSMSLSIPKFKPLATKLSNMDSKVFLAWLTGFKNSSFGVILARTNSLLKKISSICWIKSPMLINSVNLTSGSTVLICSIDSSDLNSLGSYLERRSMAFSNPGLTWFMLRTWSNLTKSCSI
ncbi:hypothetical protein WICPIJ_001992 [Wickerhamomyces pijperi]|uniref:Uncharacterized protein n=1 Tax=Wickerhamomyces pijperi TaxID=599730 RepID=A0A9P8TQ79_WICPI|nr:hypothetical protein WICPIJ_001992 [Wickerhamomyces pijperi]